MLNMLDTQDNLKNFSEDQLIREMQMPSGSAPQFMVLGEIERRKRMRADSQRQQGLMQPTVAQEAVTAAGVPQQGIAGIAQSLAPQTDMTQNTGVPNVQAAGLPGQPNQPQRMADGGVLKLAPGGSLSGVENLRVNFPDVYDRVKNDPMSLEFAASYYSDMYETPEQTTLESFEATPSVLDRLGSVIRPPVSNRRRSQQSLVDLGGLTPEEYALSQRAESTSAQRGYAADDPIFAEGSSPEYVARTSGPTPGGVVGGSMFTAPELSARFETVTGEDHTRPADSNAGVTGGLRTPLSPRIEGVRLPSADTSPRRALAGLTDSSDFGGVQLPAPLADAPADVSELQSEQARRLYLSERGYDEGDVPAIVDMLNRGREFQQSDTYTPPEQIYDLGPRGRLKYEMDSASPIEKYRAFRTTSDNLYNNDMAATIAEEDAFFAAEDARSDAQRLAPNPLAGGTEEPGVVSQIVAGIGALNRGTTEEGSDAPETVEAILPPGISPLAPVTDTPSGGTSSGGTSSGGTSSGGASDDEAPASGSRMDQDKWLALAQAGFTLMSTGDFGKAGQAGLAAYSQSKQAAQDARKLEAELAFLDARTRAANRPSGSGSGLNANQRMIRGSGLISSGNEMIASAGENADLAAVGQAMVAQGAALLGIPVPTSGTNTINLPSAVQTEE